MKTARLTLMGRSRYSEASIRRMASGLRRLRAYGRRRQFVGEVRSVVREILATVSSTPDSLPPISTWAIERILSTTKDACAVSLGSGHDRTDRNTVAILKVARRPRALAAMRREIQTLRLLAADRRLVELRALLPKVLAYGEVRGYFFLLEQALSGLDARRILSDSRAAERVQAAAARSINLLHRRTADSTVIDRTLTERWVDEPMRAVTALGYWHPRIARSSIAIEGMAKGLREALLGRRLVVSWVHGDFSPGNIRATADGLNVTGIVDWENSTRNGLPILDVMELTLSTRVEREGSELGVVLLGLLHGGGLTAHELRLLEIARSSLGEDGLGLRELLMLSWLRHVADNLARSSDLNRHRWWVRENVESVLAQA
jgi:aminoglycoside phosphotransferase